MVFLIACAEWLLACAPDRKVDPPGADSGDSAVVVDTGDPKVDDDGDGYSVEEGDCDDTRADRNPGEVEECDFFDANCDGGDLDAPDVTVYYDADVDGFGDPSIPLQVSCSWTWEGLRRGSSWSGDDCDDTDAAVHPGAEDAPEDGIDQDCDGDDG